MSKSGQTITLYMIDGEPTGRIKSYISAKMVLFIKYLEKCLIVVKLVMEI